MTTDEQILTELTELRAACPPWCERSDHESDDTSTTQPLHYGPTFGLFWVQAYSDGPMEVRMHEPSSHALNGARGLLKIARDACSAAEWLLEAQASAT